MAALGGGMDVPSEGRRKGFHLARPIGRNQTKAGIALVSVGVGLGLDQPTVGQPQTTQITRVHGQGARLEAMSLPPAFAFFA